MPNFRNKNVLVIGGSSGLGEATAHAFADAGASVTIASRSADKLKAAAERIGQGVSSVVLDTTDDAAVEAYFAKADAFDHVVDIVIQWVDHLVADLVLDHQDPVFSLNH